MEKITVSHFLNKSLKPKTENNKEKYPVYVQVIVHSKNLKFKSNNIWFEYLGENDLENDLVKGFLKDEILAIENIVKGFINIGEINLITSKKLKLYSKNLYDVINMNFSKFLQTEKEKENIFVPHFFMSASFDLINDVIFFFNDSTPFNNISDNVRLGIDVISNVRQEMINERYLVYDLYFGNKRDELFSLIEYIDPLNETEKSKKIEILKKIIEL